MKLVLTLGTLDEAMAEAWATQFRLPAVTITVGDILEADADAILSPANSFGFMDGGIDLLYSRFFGWELQEALQARITSEYDGELPVGQAIVVPTEHETIRFLVSAPTMRVPSKIDGTVNVYLAFRAALLAVQRHNAGRGQKIRSLVSPALGAGIGGMPLARVARQMFAAYSDVVLGQPTWRGTARDILRQHAGLLE